MTNANEPISPSEVQVTSKGEVFQNQIAQDAWTASGLTKREHFAVTILSGTVNENESIKSLTERAVSMADALIEALNK